MPASADPRDASDPSSPGGGAPPGGRRLPARGAGGWTWAARLILAGYFTLIGVFSPVYGPLGKGTPPPPAVELQDYFRGTEWLLRPVLYAASDAGQLFLVGLLIPMSLPRQPAGSGPRVRRTLVLLLALLLAAAFQLAQSGFPPNALRLAVPVCGCLAGAWIGLGILRGWSAALKRSLVLGVLGVLLAAGGAGLVEIMLDRQPLPLEPETVTAAERERIERLLRTSGSPGGPRQIDLTPKDANLMLAVALTSVAKEHMVKLAMAEDTVAVEASLKLPAGSGGSRYLNSRALCRLEIERGKLELDLERLRIGRLDVPAWLLPSCSERLRSAILDDPELRALVEATESLRVRPEGVEAVFRRGRFEEKLLPSLIARLNGKPDVLAATRAHFRRLAVTARSWPSRNGQFTTFVRTAFTFARERSRQSDPVLENRAAILALAILLGHPRLEQLIGPVVGDDSRPIVRQYTGRVPLRGRRDWTQHFFVSAASALLANEAIGDRIGLLKEELDATEGGSGFSFADLLADRAGVLFAAAATRDEASARAMQERVAGDFRIDEVFPPAADLPEGIPERVLKAEYGGIGGAGYRRMVEEIERRLRDCPALR